MSRSSTANVQPSLYSHKGTPVRYYIKARSGSNVLIEPLRSRAQGLVLKNSVAAQYLPSLSLDDSTMATLSGSGEVLEAQAFSSDNIGAIEATVIYPNGNTWEGALEGDMSAVGLLVWGWDLAHMLKSCDQEELFNFAKPWYEVPTTVLFFSEDKSIHCGWDHRCPKQCDAITKFM